jgi:hypothetical protein
VLVLVWLAALAATPSSASAQATREALSLTVAPPLYQISAVPGETWSSTISIVNSNPYPLTVYLEPHGFEAQDEFGRPRILSREDERAARTLPQWITLTQEPVTIPAGGTERVPFSVVVPEDAPPGGHYASIVVATEPPEAEAGGQVTISSSVASLVLLSVAGDVREAGVIREFSTEDLWHQEAEAQLLMRFQNTGNVHLRPQGVITIENMWGQERGRIDLNQATNFGNVLPGTTRRFSFTWRGQEDVFDFGRYAAIASISFGSDGARQSVTRETHFWVVPLWDVVRVLGGGALGLALLIFLVRLYVRRALRLEAERLGIHPHAPAGQSAQSVGTDPGVQPAAPPPREPSLGLGTLVRPLAQGAVDLRRSVGPRGSTTHAPAAPAEAPGGEPDLSFGTFLLRYRYFFLFLVLLGGAVMALLAFYDSVFMPERAFEIEIEQADGRFVPAARQDVATSS